MRFLAAAFVFCSLSLAAVGSAAAAKPPPPPPQFWSVSRCERVLPKEHPKILQVTCVGSGGPARCRWASGRRMQLYSELRVFAWYRHAHFSTLGMTDLEPGVIRAFTLATRARPGFARIVHRYGDQWLGWPADFYMGQVRLVATRVSAAHFRAFVAPLADKLAEGAQSTGCTAT